MWYVSKFDEATWQIGETAARIVLLAVHLDPVTRRSRPFPVNVRRRAAALAGPKA